MKKIIYFIISSLIMIGINACSGYKPIFNSSNIHFEISDYLIEGDEILGNEIYYKLLNVTKKKINNVDVKNLYIKINVSKNKSSAAKDQAGKTLEYKIQLNTKFLVKDYLTDKELLNHTFISSVIYKVQDQYSETVKLENKSINDLTNRTYQDLLTKLIENI